MEADNSKEIYEKYYNIQDKTVLIILKDNTVLEGRLVSFFHGDMDAGEPFIIKWHFVGVKEIEEYTRGLDVSLEMNQDIGRIINQKDIKSIYFKI